MDGHFVPNLSRGPLVVKALKRCTRLPLDVHLMITDPDRYLDAFIDAGADHISFHIEVAPEPTELVQRLRERGVGVGLAVNPETPVDPVLRVAEQLDMVVIMTVHPGFAGQSFLGENLEKVRALRAWEKDRAPLEDGRALDIEVDGGIDISTGPLAAKAGANVHVAGSAIFGAADPGRALAELRRALTG
jgi:ribulose-phosphate 3-epimerase